MRTAKYDWRAAATVHERQKVEAIDTELDRAKAEVSRLYANRFTITNKAAARARYIARKVTQQ